MNYRPLGRTGMSVSEISFGAWAIGGAWGAVDDDRSLEALHAAIDAGVNFVDTADVYGDGRSERLVARLRRERPRDTIFVATNFQAVLHHFGVFMTLTDLIVWQLLVYIPLSWVRQIR